eukprot:6441436-Amphidinium_carterae.1
MHCSALPRGQIQKSKITTDQGKVAPTYTSKAATKSPYLQKGLNAYNQFVAVSEDQFSHFRSTKIDTVLVSDPRWSTMISREDMLEEIAWVYGQTRLSEIRAFSNMTSRFAAAVPSGAWIRKDPKQEVNRDSTNPPACSPKRSKLQMKAHQAFNRANSANAKQE